jgi:hypothetical protein
VNPRDILLSQQHILTMSNCCQGTPDGPCPHGCCDSTVKFSIYDLFLCPRCERAREGAQHSPVGNLSMPPKRGKKAKGCSTATRTGHRTTRAAGNAYASTADDPCSQPSTGTMNADTDCIRGDIDDGRQSEQPASGRHQQGETRTVLDVGASKATATDPPPASSNELVTELSRVVDRQHEEIRRLRLQLDYVLSFLGMTETCEKVTPATIQSEPNDATKSPAADEGDSQTQWSEVTAKHQRQRQRQAANFQQTMVAAVYVDQSLKSRRESSLIVAGLDPAEGTSDAELFASVCSAEFGIKPDVAYTKRLGQSQVGKTQPLLVYLKRAEQAQHLVKEATRLRQSSNKTTRDKIFINQNLTRAEAAAAYQLRLKRRQALQRRQESRIADTNRCDNHDQTTVNDAPTNSHGYHLNSPAAVECTRLNPSAEAFIPPVPSGTISAD